MMGMPPATAASNAQDAALLLGQSRELGAVHGEQRLVGGDHVLARARRRLHATTRPAAGAADGLDDDVDVRRGGERQGIALPAHARHVDVPLAGLAPRADGNDLEAAVRRAATGSRPCSAKFDDARANGAEAGDADSERSFHGAA